MRMRVLKGRCRYDVMASSNVLLGVCDGPCSELVLSPYENKIGGYPDFFPTSSLPSLPRCTTCGGLLRLLAQIYCPLEDSVNHRLLHVYCCSVPVCYQRNKGWLALRSECRDTSTNYSTVTSANAHPTANAGTHTTSVPTVTGVCDKEEWCAGADDWGDEMRDVSLHRTNNDEEFLQGHDNLQEDIVNPKSSVPPSESNHLKEPSTCVNTTTTDMEYITSSVDTLQLKDANSLSEPTRAVSVSSLTGPYFKPLYLNVVTDSLSSSLVDSELQQAENLLQRYVEDGKQSDLVSVELAAVKGNLPNTTNPPTGRHGDGEQGCMSEKYEKMVVKHGDTTFQKFKKALSRCPSQVLRYSWKGEPLLISDKQQMPQHGEITCKSCGSPTVFEFQLMPPLVYILQQSKKRTESVAAGACTSSANSVEFGTVLIYTCSRSCWENDEDEFREERIFVLADPENEIIRNTFHNYY